jgi:hypothetical protein
MQTVTVTDSDVIDLTLTIPSTFEITGHLEIAAAPGRVVCRPARMRMTFRSANQRSAVVVQPDGTFAVTLTEGEYVVCAEDLPDGYSLRSITSDAIDLTTSAMRIEAGMNPPEPIRVVLQCKTA